MTGTGSPAPRIGAYLGLVPTEYSSGQPAVAGLDHQDRQQPRPPAAGRGRLAPPHALPQPGATMRARWELRHRRPRGPAATPATGACTQRWVRPSRPRKKRPVVANVAVARELAGWCWSLADTETDSRPALPSCRSVGRRAAARGATRDTAMSSQPLGGATLDS